jgi:hypothetical protein
MLHGQEEDSGDPYVAFGNVQDFLLAAATEQAEQDHAPESPIGAVSTAIAASAAAAVVAAAVVVAGVVASHRRALLRSSWHQWVHQL